ncbi:MAG: ATP-binding protein [Jaaginema sp. PMC 1079.18]|nr:ATP-binding protein [Jaaginema sp. PMC 1080.18]MEC4850585.1 ATP-binding protein [Jaaginema sp. PMC 1079.18]MEC4867083.1 ATP-binding protein [Jaaginema sp. PMC 1078.18]
MDRDDTSELLRQRLIESMLAHEEGPALLSAITEVLGQTYQADACWVITHPANGDRAMAASWSERNFRVFSSEDVRQLFWQPLFTLDLTEMRAIEDSHSLALSFPAEFPVRSLLCLPTYHQNRVNGAVAIARFHSHPWSTAEKSDLQTATQILALACDRAFQQQQAAINRRHQQLLNRLSTAVSNTSNLNHLQQLALAEIGQAFAIDRAWLIDLKYDDPLFTPHRDREVPAAIATAICDWCDRPVETYVGRSFRLHQCWFCVEAWRSLPEPYTVSHRDTLPGEVLGRSPAWIKNKEQQALLLLPLFGRSSTNNPTRILGFLILQHHSPRTWTATEIELATWVSTQIRIATLNHQALQQVRDLVEERTAQLKWSLEVQAKLSEKMRQQIDQLQQLNQLKDEFLDTIQHELRTPLATMKMAIRMLRQPGLPAERQEKYLDILEQEWQREDHLIQDLLALQKLESNQVSLQPQRLDLKSFIAGITTAFLPKWKPKGLMLETTYIPDEDKIGAYIDPESLDRILTELLTNASKYATAKTTIQLTLEQVNQEKGDRLILRVSNTGSPIDPDDLDSIFEKFHRGKGVTAQAIPGTGLGLALVKSLVHHLEGEVTVESNTDKTTFTVSIPLSQEFYGA